MNYSVVLLLLCGLSSCTESAEAIDKEDLVCSIPQKELPVGVPFFIPGPAWMVVEFGYGIDVPKVDKALRVCSVSIHYKLYGEDGEEIKSGNKTLKSTYGLITITFTGLKKNSMHQYEWHLRYYKDVNDYVPSTTETVFTRTINLDYPTKEVEMKYDEKKGTITLMLPNSPPHFAYYLWVTPLQIQGLQWSNSSQWKEVLQNKKEFVIDVSHQFYTKLYIVVILKENGQWMRPKKFTPFGRQSIGSPDNDILNIAFSNETWIIDVEKNIYKQNSPDLHLYYELSPKDGPNDVAKGKIDTKSVEADNWRFEITVPLIYNTDYELSVSLDPAMKHLKKFTYKVPPAELRNPSSFTMTERTSSTLLITMKQSHYSPFLQLYLINTIDTLEKQENITRILTETELVDKVSTVLLTDLKEREKYLIRIKSCSDNQEICTDWSQPKSMTTLPNFEPLYHIQKDGDTFCVEWTPFTSVQEKWKVYLLYKDVTEDSEDDFPSFSDLQCNSENYFLKETSTMVILLRNLSSYECYENLLPSNESKIKLTPAACLDDKDYESENWFYESSRFVIIDFNNTEGLSKWTIIIIEIISVCGLLIAGICIGCWFCKRRKKSQRLNTAEVPERANLN